MSEWKGPWTCEKCGTFFRSIEGDGYHRSNESRTCDGKLIPFDRRFPSPEIARLREALEKIEHGGCTEDAHIARQALDDSSPYGQTWIKEAQWLLETPMKHSIHAGGSCPDPLCVEYVNRRDAFLILHCKGY